MTEVEIECTCALLENMERRIKNFVISKRFRTSVLIGTILVVIVALYYLDGATISENSPLARLLSSRQKVNNIHSSTTEELDHTIRVIRYKNCLLKYNHDVKRCKFYDLCNRYSNSTDAFGCHKQIPGCLVIGVYKAGTRALVDFLSMHPRVVVRKYPYYELQFFDKNFHRGMNWYKNEMPYSMPDQITIEKSPSYFQSAEGPARIFATNPDMKLILMVRNPIDRAISHFTFDSFVAKSHYGGEIKNCILDPWTRKVNKNCFAVKNSVYDEAYERYLSFFHPKQILVIEYEEFIANPFRILKLVEEFLQLDSVIQEENFIFSKEKGFYCLRESVGSSISCYDKTRGRDISTQRHRDLGKPLLKYFYPHNWNFFKLIGQNYNWTSPFENLTYSGVKMVNPFTRDNISNFGPKLRNSQ